jgi:hypothetical protein
VGTVRHVHHYNSIIAPGRAPARTHALMPAWPQLKAQRQGSVRPHGDTSTNDLMTQRGGIHGNHLVEFIHAAKIELGLITIGIRVKPQACAAIVCAYGSKWIDETMNVSHQTIGRDLGDLMHCA